VIWFFIFFSVSGFCSILYELVWLRLAMAQFGVTSALVSLVLSTFMAGLGLGSWASGLLLRKYQSRIHFPVLHLYALTELLIGISAVSVPHQLRWGRELLRHVPLISSVAYYVTSGAWIGLTLVPWCACMGATIPVAMQAIRRSFQEDTQRSFSYLYLANVLGAVAGSFLPLLLIEKYGFQGTLRLGAILNFLLAISALAVLAGKRGLVTPSPAPLSSAFQRAATHGNLVLLFATGLTSLGMEVIWIRQFTPYVGTVVYSFALILAIYLAATFFGSRLYRIWSRKPGQQESAFLWVALGSLALLPVVTSEPRFQVQPALRLWLGIAPFSAVLGFVTPMLIDRWSSGDPDRAGTAYAVNVAGCIVGPLFSGFVLLPLLSERWALFVLSLPWLLGIFFPETLFKRERLPTWQRRSAYAFAALAMFVLIVSRDFEDRISGARVLRDHTATVIAVGDGLHKQLLVNGVGISYLTPVTKMMAHLPLASLDHAPHSALVICFGMGTTFRSLLSWSIPTSAVELVPSVPRLFGYYHADGPRLLQSNLSHVVIDDGRRYLERTDETYDVITLDPPPPVAAAGSSLLYSKEFYATAKRRLRPHGVVQQWLPYADGAVYAAVARALQESFRDVRVYQNPSNKGLHFLASEIRITTPSAEQLVKHMPQSAVRDLLEWDNPVSTAEADFAAVISHELPLSALIEQDPNAPALQDDRPVNEYYLLRRRTGRSREFRLGTR
jgi:spermidine synthase